MTAKKTPANTFRQLSPQEADALVSEHVPRSLQEKLKGKRVFQIAGTVSPDRETGIRFGPLSEYELECQRGLDLWNSGMTWREVNAALGHDDNDLEVAKTKKRIRSFCKKYGLEPRKGRHGRPKK